MESLRLYTKTTILVRDYFVGELGRGKRVERNCNQLVEALKKNEIFAVPTRYPGDANTCLAANLRKQLETALQYIQENTEPGSSEKVFYENLITRVLLVDKLNETLQVLTAAETQRDFRQGHDVEDDILLATEMINDQCQDPADPLDRGLWEFQLKVLVAHLTTLGDQALAARLTGASQNFWETRGSDQIPELYTEKFAPVREDPTYKAIAERVHVSLLVAHGREKSEIHLTRQETVHKKMDEEMAREQAEDEEVEEMAIKNAEDVTPGPMSANPVNVDQVLLSQLALGDLFTKEEQEAILSLKGDLAELIMIQRQYGEITRPPRAGQRRYREDQWLGMHDELIKTTQDLLRSTKTFADSVRVDFKVLSDGAERLTKGKTTLVDLQNSGFGSRNTGTDDSLHLNNEGSSKGKSKKVELENRDYTVKEAGQLVEKSIATRKTFAVHLDELRKAIDGLDKHLRQLGSVEEVIKAGQNETSRKIINPVKMYLFEIQESIKFLVEEEKKLNSNARKR